MSQQTPYAEERLRIWNLLRQEAPHGSLAELFRPAAADLRFRLGTSLADLRIPFKIASALRQIMTHGAIEAYLLAGQRHKSNITTTEYDRLVTTEGFDPTKLRPLGYALPSAVTREHVRRIFFDAMDVHAGVDAGLVASFMGTERPGRRLAAAVHALFSKAREEAGRSDGEPTVYLVALMLRSLAEGTYALTRDAPIGEPMARFLRTAAATLLAEATQLALREAGLFKHAGLNPFSPATEAVRDPLETQASLLAVATLGVLPFFGPRPALAGSGLSAYGVQFDQMPVLLDEALVRLGQAGSDPENVARDIAAAFLRDRDQQRKAERLGAFASLREKTRELARLLETTTAVALSIPGEGRIDRVLSGREGLERLFASESKRKELALVARNAARQAPSEAIRQRLEILAHAAREYRDEEPGAWLGAAEARLRTARAVVALAADVLIERHVAPASQLLLERTGAETEGGETAEYESGRLYYVSHEPGPLLKDRTQVRRVGHLFCDMKDFTRRTAFLKESVITDFLQREFYAPILALASGLDPGSRTPSAGSEISLNNLLGDAVSFSGDVVALMHLAQSIHAVLKDYGRRLEAESSREVVAARVTELERQHERRRAGLERSLRELTARAATARGETRDAMLLRAEEIRAELSRQTALFHAELARASGEKLEAGIFISYGAAPEVARFEDPYFGALKVAIAEKINESARGTARTGAVREKVEVLRRRACASAGRELEQGFSVLVETPATFAFEPEEAMVIAELISRGHHATAQQRLLKAAQQSAAGPKPIGELYNHGIACSEEALRAYLEARGDEIQVVRQELSVKALHPQIRERFFIPRDSLQVVACIAPASRALAQLFVFQGRAVFRGFETTDGLGIYEVLPTRSALFELFARHHLPQWLSR